MRMQTILQAFLALALVLWAALPAAAHDGVKVDNAYARFLPGAKSGVAYFDIMNHSLSDDRLLSAHSPVAKSVDLHGSMEGADGMMTMTMMDKGIAIPGLQTVRLAPGGVHLMFTGLQTVPREGESFPVELVFERSGAITLQITVQNRHKADAASGTDMNMDMGHDMAPSN